MLILQVYTSMVCSDIDIYIRWILISLTVSIFLKKALFGPMELSEISNDQII